MICRSISIVALATSSLLFLGCANAQDDDDEETEEIVVGTSTSALECDINSDTCDPTIPIGPGPSALTMTSFNRTTLTLVGTNASGQQFSAQFSQTLPTWFRVAIPTFPLIPTEPFRTYNLAVLSFDRNRIFDAIPALVGHGRVRIWVGRYTGIVRAFRPVP